MKEHNQYLRIFILVLIAAAASYAVVHPHTAEVSSSEHGSVSEEGTVRFYSGLFLGINPDPGYYASVYVDGELADYDGSGTFLYRTNVFNFDTHKIHVDFERNASLYVHHNEGGTVTPNGSVYATGDVRIVATPNEGYVIDDVIINGAHKGSINVIDVHVSEPTDVMVKFRPAVAEDREVDISVTSSVTVHGDYGSVHPEGKSNIKMGGTLVIRISINPGYELEQVYVNGIPYLNLVSLYANDVSEQSKTTDITITNVDSDVVVEVVIKKIIQPGEAFNIDILPSEGGKTNPSGKIVVAKGSDLEIKLIPDFGYEVSTITVDGITYDVSGDTYVIKDINKDMVVSVEFKKIATGIKIDSLPDKISYVVGDKLDITGLKISLVFKDGSTIPISDYSIDPYELKNSGEQKITVEYNEFKIYFTVKVKSVSEVFNVKVDSFDGKEVGKRLKDYPIEFGVFEPGTSKDLVLTINSDGACDAYLKLDPQKCDHELTDKIIVSIDGVKVGTLTELLSGQYHLGTISGSKTLTINFSFPHGEKDPEALGKQAIFTMAIMASSI